MAKFLTLILVCITLLFTSCCSCRKGSPVIGNLENTEWKLVEINETKTESNVIIIFDPLSKVINGNCNNCKLYGGYHLYEKDNGNIEFLNPGYNGDDCGIFSELTSVLKDITTVKIDSGHLLLIDKEGNLKAIFTDQSLTK